MLSWGYNTKHHEGLHSEPVRTLVAEAIRDDAHAWPGEPNDEYRAMLVRNIEEATARLKSYDKGRALRIILDQLGWKVREVDDLVDYNPKTYIHFIGTESELKSQYPNADTPDE